VTLTTHTNVGAAWPSRHLRRPAPSCVPTSPSRVAPAPARAWPAAAPG